MKSFYGGSKGENYVVSHIFPNRQSLFNDLTQGVASPVGLNEIIMISYGNYNSKEYESNLGIDGGLPTINPFYFTHNPFLYYEPSDKELNYEAKYTILDERYGGSYNGIKNKQSDHSVWIQFLVQGTISFNGNFIKNVSDNNKEDYWKPTTAFHCYLATSIEAAKSGKSIKHTNFSIEDINEDSGKFEISSLSEHLFNWNIETQNYEATIEGNDDGKPYYLIMRVMPYTAVTFGKTFSVTPFNHYSLFNYNSALFQKVLNTPHETLNPVIDVIESNVNNYAYKFLTSSLGTTPHIEIDGTVTTLDYNDSPKITKTEGSTWDKTTYELQLPDQTQLKLSGDYKQLNIVGQVGKEENFIIESYNFPEFTAKYEEGNLVLYLKDLNTEQTQTLTSVKTVPSFRVTVLEGENVFENQYILQYKFSFEKEDDEWHNVIDNEGKPINLNFQGSLISTAELEDKSGYKIFIDNKGTEADETIVIKHGDKGDKGDTGKPLQISYSFNSRINSATEMNFIDLSNEQQNNYIAEALNNQDIQFPYNLYDEDEALRLNEAFMGNIIYNNANENLENILVFYFNTGKYVVEGEISAIADNEFVSNKLIEDEDADGNKIIKYQIISYSFLYFNNDITNTLIKNITSLDNQSLVLNTSDNYDPTDKIFGAEGLTAGETNKIGTKVFDIVGYEGTEGGEGYYVLSCDSEQQAADMLTDISAAIQEQKNKSKALKWSIKAGFCYDYAGNIIKVEEMKDENVLEISQEFQDFSFDSGQSRADTSFYNPINNTDYTSLLNSNDLGTIILNDELSEKIDSIEIEPLTNTDYKYTWTTPNFIIVYEIGNITISKRNVDSNFNELTKITIQMNLQSNENTKKLKLTIDNFYSNAVLKGQESKYLPNSFKDTDRPGYYDCAPLGYYIEHQINEGSTEATEGILYICGYPEIGTRELFGRSYSFGSNNISQQAFSFQSGYGNKGYNKYGITVGQNNISGFGNAIFGRNIDAGFAQMNISQGDYNKIGNYAKYNAQFGLGLENNYDHHYQFGKYNKNRENNVLEIGNGTGEQTRSNLFEINNKGKIYSNELENMIDQKLELEFKGLDNVQKEQLTSFSINESTYSPGQGILYYIEDKYSFEEAKNYLVKITIKIKPITAGKIRIVGAKRNANLTVNPDSYDIWPSLIPEFNNNDINKEHTYYFYRMISNKQNKDWYGLGVTNATDSSGSIQFNYEIYELLDTEEKLNNNILLEKFCILNNLKKYQIAEHNVLSSESLNPYAVYINKENNKFISVSKNKNLILNTYIPSEYSQYISQKWNSSFALNPLTNYPLTEGETDYVLSLLSQNFASQTIGDIINNSYIQKLQAYGFLTNWNEKTEEKIDSKHIRDFLKIISRPKLENSSLTLSCLGLSADQDVMISFNPEDDIDLETYTQQKEVYDLIISNSYAKTINDKVIIHIVNPDIIDENNETECPILIKVV